MYIIICITYKSVIVSFIKSNNYNLNSYIILSIHELTHNDE